MADVSSTHLLWGQGIAKGQGQSSTAMLTCSLKIAPSIAQSLQAKWVDQGVLGAPNTSGARVALRPFDATGRSFGQPFRTV